MNCAVAVANSPVFSPSRIPSIFCKTSSSTSPRVKLALHGSSMPSPASSPSARPFSFSSPPSSPFGLRLQKQLNCLRDCTKDASPSVSPAPSVPVLKRKRPAKIEIPKVPTGLFAVSTPSVAVETVDDVEIEGDGYSVYCKRGRRGVMEDRYSAVVDLREDFKQAFFGVFDGHGGAKAAEFAAKNLDKNIMNEVTRSDVNIEESIKIGYLATDAECLKEDFGGGTCCVTALIHKGDIVVSNAGDCQAVMSRGGVAELLTINHRPSRVDERTRIEALGGYVDCCRGVWRVQGSLAVSRGIGDSHLKQWITAEPETKIIRLKPDCEFIILASDGLWDKVTDQEAVDLVRASCTGASKPKPFSACKCLAELSVRRGSIDDITVMIVQLGPFIL